MEIQEKINEVENYFIQKVINGDYQFIKADEHNAEIKVDDKYLIKLWIANGVNNLDFYCDWVDSESILKPKLKTMSQKQKAWTKINEHVKEYQRTKLKKEKQKQIDKLTAELKKL